MGGVAVKRMSDFRLQTFLDHANNVPAERVLGQLDKSLHRHGVVLNVDPVILRERIAPELATARESVMPVVEFLCGIFYVRLEL